MRRVPAVALLLVVVAAVGLWLLPAFLQAPPEAVPNASFDVSGDPTEDRLVVEHAGGETFESGELAVLVYEDRPVVPDRTVHRTTWETNTTVRPGDRLELEDTRFEPKQRVVVRWFGEAGQANLHETVLK
ncbi:type IV pilin N-terminal domain-containing protein [Natronomonas halophila]|uniref:type IV pilin N-terminal domain-containing protein n=1 Tax=Natronomonas halophila TaxID=2747817 RepID=UPI0015B3F3AA|nr:type IV pilin N-terminal domain-containing protein [Natronomonas halophila]QLD85311.1 type IV pilin N-terminal domain-containing protein [Natronomonas halophila]